MRQQFTNLRTIFRNKWLCIFQVDDLHMPLRVMLMAGSMDSGGSERQTLTILRHLDRARFAPELYLVYRRGVLLQSLPNDVPVHAFDDDPLSIRVNWPGRIHRRQGAHFRDLVASRQIDVVYDRTYHMTLIAARGCDRLQVPRLATIVSPPSLDLRQSENRFFRIKKLLLARAYQRAARVLAVSHAVRDDAIEFYHLPPDHVRTLHSGIDLQRLQDASQLGMLPAPWLALGQLALGQRALGQRALGQQQPALFHVACIGRMTAEKGHTVLLQGLQALQRHTPAALDRMVLWMIGDGPLRGALEQQVASHQLNSHVQFLGTLANVAPLLARCSLLVCPSTYEGWSNAILEAFALKVPVIATAAGGNIEMLGDGTRGRLVAAGDGEGLGSAIAELRASATKRQQYSERAYRYLHDHWQISAVMPRLEEELITAAEESARGTSS